MRARLVLVGVVVTLLALSPAASVAGTATSLPAEPSALLETALGLAAASWLSRRCQRGGRRAPTETVGAAALASAPDPLDVLPAAPKVSVVIPTYNRAHIVGEAIQSVLAQTYTNLEVIVVDDGSTDDTDACVGRLADPRVRYLKRPHAGVSATRNAAIAVATGELVSFLDSDDLWKPDKLQAEVAFLARHPEVHAVFSDLEKVDDGVYVPSFMRTTAAFSRRLVSTSYPDGLALSPTEMLHHLLEEIPIKTAGLTIRRDVIERAGRFDESWASAEDWEFLLRVARIGRFGYLDRALAVIRIYPDSLHRAGKEADHRAMLHLLWQETRRAPDRATRAAARRGISGLVKHLSRYYLASGRRLDACGACVRGFVQTWDGGLLLRAAAVALPRGRTVAAIRNLAVLIRTHGLTPTAGR